MIQSAVQMGLFQAEGPAVNFICVVMYPLLNCAVVFIHKYFVGYTHNSIGVKNTFKCVT